NAGGRRGIATGRRGGSRSRWSQPRQEFRHGRRADQLVPKLAARFQSLPEYPLATIPQKKRELLMRGVDVIDLGAGDADLAPPAAVLDAVASAVHNPTMNRYGFGLGLVAFREAVSTWMNTRFGVKADPLKEIVPLI